MPKHFFSGQAFTSASWSLGLMKVEFADGNVRLYHRVSESEYNHFINSSSPSSVLKHLGECHEYDHFYLE